jgi:hypothetical protein
VLITDNLQSTTGCPTVVEFRQGLCLDRDLDVEEQDDNLDKRFTQVQAARKHNTLHPASRVICVLKYQNTMRCSARRSEDRSRAD